MGCTAYQDIGEGKRNPGISIEHYTIGTAEDALFI